MFKASPRGQGLVEYAFIIILVAILVIVMLALFGSGVGSSFQISWEGIILPASQAIGRQIKLL